MNKAKVVVLGDIIGAGEGDWISMAPRIAEAGNDYFGFSLAGEGGIRAAHARLPQLRQLGHASVGVLILGTEDAKHVAPLRPWVTLLRQCFRALAMAADTVVVVLPLEISTELPVRPGYTKEARRWVRRIRADIGTVIEDEVKRHGLDGTRVVIIDPAKSISDAMREDGVLLKPSGYEALAELIANSVEEARKQSKR